MKVPLLVAACAILSLASTPILAQDANNPPPAADAKTQPPAPPPRPYTQDDCQEMNAQLDDSIKTSNLDAKLTEKIRRQRSGADQSCNSGDYAAGARQLRRILDEVIEARSAPAAETKTSPPAAETKTPPPAPETPNPPPAAETKTPPPAPATTAPPPSAETKAPPPVAPPRPYTEDDCQDMNAQLDDSIESSNLDPKFAEKIRRQRIGADESCNSGDFAAGAR